MLQLYDTEEEAYFWEQSISGKFGIPQLMFNPKKMTRGTSMAYLPKAWEYIGDNSSRAYVCLEYFGKMLNHPLFVTNDGLQQSAKRPRYTRAANLVDKAIVLPFNNQCHVNHNSWEEITIKRDHYEGDIVSLVLADKNPFVANEILVR